MSRKGENIYLRKDGRWEGRYIKGRKPDGSPRFCSIYGKQYREVKKRLVLIKAELCREDPGLLSYGTGTFRKWGDFWLEEIAGPHIKQTTLEGYRRILNKHLYPQLGQEKLPLISRDRIQALALTLQERLAPSTLSGVCRLLKSILAAAKARNLIRQNPYQEIKLPRVCKTAPRVLTRQEQICLEKEIEREGALEYLICLYTGLRVGEVCALRWKDIDFKNESIQVRHSIQRIPEGGGRGKTRLALGTPKTGNSLREIPLPGFLRTRLQEEREKRNPDPDSFLFPGRGGSCRDPRAMQKRLERMARRLELPGVHMHTLRHTFAARCLEQKVGYEILSELLGHASPQITLRCYAHCTREKKRQSMADLKLLSAWAEEASQE